MLALTPTARAEGKRRPSGRGKRPARRPARWRPFVAALGTSLKWGLRIVPVVAVVGGVGWFFASGTARDWSAVAGDRALWLTADAGLRVEEVLVEGRGETRRDEVLAALGVGRGEPILAFDPWEARAELAKIPWIERVEVERRLPDTIFVRLYERRALALWQRDGRMVVIDDDGHVLTDRPQDLSRFHNLPLVVGAGAEREARALVIALREQPALAERVAAGIWVGARRWDLRLDNGVTVRLPETGVVPALARLAAAQTRSPFLDRDVVAVDLRQTDRLIVQLGPAAAERMRPPPPANRRS
jgi:cell division protein FtsQ